MRNNNYYHFQFFFLNWHSFPDWLQTSSHLQKNKPSRFMEQFLQAKMPFLLPNQALKDSIIIITKYKTYWWKHW